jgi:hypothetical protein
MTFPPATATFHPSRFSAHAAVTPRFGQARETLPEHFPSFSPEDITSFEPVGARKHTRSGPKGHSGLAGAFGKTGAALWNGLKSALKWGGGSAVMMWPPAALMGILGFIPVIGHFIFMPIAIVLASVPVLLGSLTGTLAALKTFKK